MTAIRFATGSSPLETEVLDQLFTGAHTTNTFTDQPVKLELIQRVYEDTRWAPTQMNIQPLRLSLIASREAREQLVAHMAEGNQAKTRSAPLALVAAYDPRWHDHMPHLAPHRVGIREEFETKTENREQMGRDNGLIQIGYLLLALRAHGLQVGPMNGLDPEGVDRVFHAENGWKTLMVINVGHAPNQEDESAQRPRAGRLEFDLATQVR